LTAVFPYPSVSPDFRNIRPQGTIRTYTNMCTPLNCSSQASYDSFADRVCYSPCTHGMIRVTFAKFLAAIIELFSQKFFKFIATNQYIDILFHYNLEQCRTIERTLVAILVGHCASSRNVSDSIPDGVTGIFH